MKKFLKLIIYKFIEFSFKLEKSLKIKGVGYYIIRWEIMRNYRFFMHKEIDLKNPKDLNEKINWLKLNDDYNKWALLADKYMVREFVESKGLKDILIPLYGVWDSTDRIELESLPSSFVLKTNHGSGDVIIVRDKNSFDMLSATKKLNDFLKMPYGVGSGEPHYLFIDPKVVAEKLLTFNDSFSTSLIDYKIWCFNGQPHHIWACYSRTKKEVKVEIYDLEWRHHPENSVFNDHYVDGGGIVPKPKNFERMLEIARILSSGFKQVRVDLYNIDGDIYFGEMTFTGNGGYMDFYTSSFLQEMGQIIDINN